MKRLIAIVLLTILALHPNPLLLGAVQNEEARFKMKLQGLGVPEYKVDRYNHAIKQASALTGIEKEMIAALIYTESTFDEHAKSGTGYFGAMQIPYKIFDIQKNVLIGTCILEEKLKGARGNIKLALARYKGWKDPKRGEKQVNAVLYLYKRLQRA